MVPGYHFMFSKKVIVLIFLIVICIYFSGQYYLIVQEGESGDMLWKARVKDKSGFALEYLHSVEKTPVVEYFEVREKEVYLVGTRYESYGAGLPFLKRYNYIVENNKFEIRDINQRLGEIRLRVSDYGNHKFIYEGREYLLNRMVEVQKLVIIKVVKKNIFEMLIEEDE